MPIRLLKKHTYSILTIVVMIAAVWILTTYTSLSYEAAGIAICMGWIARISATVDLIEEDHRHD